ncbi:spermatogenesis-associated protein 1-like isoform X2 [Ruditapes philippinarum]|uniref:spermatogenesis-associated protein 1-like isoform X2 n=1 Tax=Ruditapes philippinarum TaxID=129788 RepID=UPI00295B72A8|nr:spermatogenesis-associated protein 1-like isoform X2 [Ruditapes philippinarum]
MTLPIIPKETSNVVKNVPITSKENSNISKNELTKYPSPPPLRLASPDRDTASARERRKRQKEELLRELDEARDARRAAERQREELVKHAKQMQTKTQNKRNHARDLWKKRYFEEKKKTGPLEEQCNRLRHELDIIHKKLLTTLEGPKEKATKLNDIKPSNKVGSPGRPVNNFKIQATRLQHEIEDVRRRVDHAKMKLTSEMKLRNQAETELRALRAELTQKKINLTLSRNSHLTTYAPPAADVNLISTRTGLTPRS